MIGKLFPQLCLCAGLMMFVTRPVTALTVPFTEDFDTTAEGWANYNGTFFIDHAASGGPDGGAYGSADYSFENASTGGDTPVIIRGHEEAPYSFSGLNFVGDWAAAGAVRLSAYVRHDAPTALSYFVRVSNPDNFPGAVAIEFAPVSPNVWTELSFDLSPASPQIVTFEGTDWETVLSDIGHIQFGVTVPDSLAGDEGTYTFDIDKVMLTTPEPASLALALSAILGVLVWRRKRRR